MNTKLLDARKAELVKTLDESTILEYAAKWDALVNANHVRLLGHSGCKPGDTSDYKHAGFEIWTHHNPYYDKKGRRVIDALAEQLIVNQQNAKNSIIVFNALFSPTRTIKEIVVKGGGIHFHVSLKDLNGYLPVTQESIKKYIIDFGVCVDVSVDVCYET